MKVKNDFITIKMGKKQYDFKNLILDEYLSRIIKRQIDTENLSKIYCDIELKYLLIKFDDPLENITGSAEIHNNEFDIAFVKEAVSEQDISPNAVSIKYTYEADNRFVVYDYEQRAYNHISDYYGKQITAIGFNSWNGNDTGWANPWPVCAVLDTSNYNLYLQENELFTVVRKDIITTDADFYSKFPKIQAPAHLCPKGIDTNKDGYVNNYYGILYSVGFSNYKDKMAEEFIVGPDVSATQNGNELIIETLTNQELLDNLLYPLSTTFSSSDLYSTKDNYTKVLLKYKIYRIEYIQSGDDIVPSYIDTGKYYLQSMSLNEYGTGNLKIKYERG